MPHFLCFIGKIAGIAILWSPLVCLHFPHDRSWSALLMSEDLNSVQGTQWRVWCCRENPVNGAGCSGRRGAGVPRIQCVLHEVHEHADVILFQVLTRRQVTFQWTIFVLLKFVCLLRMFEFAEDLTGVFRYDSKMVVHWRNDSSETGCLATK